MSRGETLRLVRNLVKGFLSFAPGANRVLLRRGTGGSGSARYCYSVWLRHLVRAQQSGLDSNPAVVAELGPGDSVGIGLAALLTGAERYYALDAVPFCRAERNLAVLEELVELVRRREPIPSDTELPGVVPRLDCYAFPSHILTDERLSQAASKERVAAIRRVVAVDRDCGAEAMLAYRAPWDDQRALAPDSVDMLISQAVLEHVDRLAAVYEASFWWLRTGGFASHSMGFESHGTASAWNGYWTYSDLVWRLVRGNQPYLLNRQPYSEHLRLLRAAGFELVCTETEMRPSAVSRRALAPRFSYLSDKDLTTYKAFVQVRKPAAEGEGQNRSEPAVEAGSAVLRP